ncbi:PREDICTED: RPA-interacting protein A-like [Amphimedon queenslandica]|uniref:RPA-interacting protein C-terminal domain-containing protein n=1 Tax=Amphimedon queenslandica TaxID=400682 RepID=A0A1X7VI88_AMPQE|nr:PREDICTED: RPA-interacting protein A-like [Amphimedon queenslandica]|eukprot:XP_003384126.1 PREDICTED: RPA-interacting protein A-like [Amphimedon queenslandica]
MATSSTPPSSKDRKQLNARKALYKNEGKRTEWKETYRQRCSERLRRNREAVVDSRRIGSSVDGSGVLDAVYEAMQEEWDNFRKEAELPPLLIRGAKRQRSSSFNEDPIGENLMYTPERSTANSQWTSPDSESHTHSPDIDIILMIMEDITEELLKEEQERLAAQYEESTTSALVSFDSDPIICPICLRDVLTQDYEFIRCSCGLSINTAQDGITLEYVRLQLREASLQHSQCCSSPPQFSYQEFLLMSCKDCDFLYIIV